MNPNNFMITDIDEAQKLSIECAFNLSRIINNNLKKNKNNFLSFSLDDICKDSERSINISLASRFYNYFTTPSALDISVKKQVLDQHIIDLKSSIKNKKEEYQPFIDIYKNKRKEIKHSHSLKKEDLKRNIDKFMEDKNLGNLDDFYYDEYYEAISDLDEYDKKLALLLSDITVNISKDDLHGFSIHLVSEICSQSISYLKDIESVFSNAKEIDEDIVLHKKSNIKMSP